MKSVIINADDFGATSAVNCAVIRAHIEGVLTSASLMVNEMGADNAAELAKEHPDLAVGLHLVLSDGVAAMPRNSIPHLVNRDDRFRDSPAISGIVSFFSSKARRESEREIEEQFARFEATALPFSHVDGHQHLHMHPVIWDAAIRQCEVHGVRCIRIVNEEPAPGTPPGRRVETLFFRALRKRCLRTLIGRGFTIVDRVYGHLQTGNMNSEYTAALLSRLGGQTNEIYFHPGRRHARLLMVGSQGMDVELDALLSPLVREAIQRNGLELTTYPDLAQRLNSKDEKQIPAG